MIESDVIQIQQNVPCEYDIYIYDDTVDPPVLSNITGLTVFISVKNINDYKLDDSDALITSKITVHTDPTNGHTIWTLTASETLQKLDRYKCDMRLFTDAFIFVNSDTFYVDIVPVVTERLV